MSSEEIVTVLDRDNSLLNRRELKVIIKNPGGQLNKASVASLVAEYFHLSERQQVIPISMKNETGKRDLLASLYVYPSLEEIQKQLPRYMMLRNMSKEDRKKIIDEEKSAKVKAKQVAAAEARSGRGKKP